MIYCNTFIAMIFSFNLFHFVENIETVNCKIQKQPKLCGVSCCKVFVLFKKKKPRTNG